MDRIIEKKKWTNRKIAYIAGAIFLLVFVIYQIFGNTGSKLNVEIDKISIATVSVGAFQEFIAIDGTIQPIKTYYLDIIEGGTVEKKFMEDGRKIKKGDTILKLTNTALQLDFMNRETQLYDLMNERQTTETNMRQDEITTLNQMADVEYQLKLADRIYRRNEDLVKSNMVSQEEYKQSKDNYEYQRKRHELSQKALAQNYQLRQQRVGQLDESIRRMQKNVGLSQNTLNNLYVTAPIDGQLSTLKAEIGEAKQVGENIGQIDDLNGFKVRADIDEHYISKVYVGLKGEFELNDKTYQLSIKKVFPEVQNGEFQIDLEFENDIPKGIRRGQTLQIRLQLSDASKAVLIPRSGFFQTTGGNWIFVVNGNTAERRSIRIGRQNPKFYEVLEGLKVGEKVIISSYEGYERIDKLILNK